MVMTKSEYARFAGFAAAAALAASLVPIIAGCAGPAAGPGSLTAKSLLPAAQSQLSTTAPDAKLLVVQTTNVVSPTSTPTWGYLFGDAKTGTVYVVTMNNGKPGPAQVYGQASLTPTQWAQVPSADAWKVDSDVAYQKAVGVNSKGASAPYTMGVVTYLPPGSGGDLKPFEWSVVFDPDGSKPTTVTVNATTGDATPAK
jgi:hypothetical protein